MLNASIIHRLSAVLTVVFSLLATSTSYAASPTPDASAAPWSIQWWREDPAYQPYRFMRDSVQVMMVELTPAGPRPDNDSVELELTVPAGVSVIDPSQGRLTLASYNNGKPWPIPFFYFTPRTFHSDPLPDGGRRYVMSGFPKYETASCTNVLSLTLVLSDSLQDGNIHCELKQAGNHAAAPGIDFPFQVVPNVTVPVSRRQVMAAPDVIYLGGASETEWKAIVGFWNRIGINHLWIRPRAFYPEMRDRNIQFSRFVRQNFPHIRLGYWMPWITPFSPYNDQARNFIRAHPEAAGVVYRANDRADLAKGGVISNEYLTHYPNAYFDQTLVPNLKLAEASGISIITWDAELMNPWAYSYAPSDLKAFRAFAHVSDQVELTPQIILKDYRNQWLKFRLDQNARIAKVYAQYVRAVTPDMQFAIYSGWDIPHTIDRYGVRWSSFAPLADLVIPGSEGPASQVLKMHQLLQAVSRRTELFFTIQGMNSWDRKHKLPPNLTLAKAMAAMANGGQGYLLWWWGGAAATQWHQMAQANLFASTFHDILNQPDRTEALQWIKGRAGAFRVSRAGKTLIICANPTKEAVTLNPLAKPLADLPTSAVWYDQTSGKGVDSHVLDDSIHLQSGQVQVYCVGPKEWIDQLQR